MAGDLAGTVVVLADDAYAAAAAERLAAATREAVVARGAASLALAGGSTPRPVYRQLARLPVPWDRVTIYFGDERAVPPGDPGSNYLMARETLLDPAGIAAARVHRMPAERADGDAAAVAYAALLPERIDVLILGIGADGHTASLFPGAPALAERRRVAVVEGPVPPRRRLTITPPVIAAARARFVLARGSDKAAAVARARSGGEPPDRVPATLARDAVWLLDAAAAGRAAGVRPA